MKSKQYTLDDKLTFGKYRGQTIREVLSKDAEYVEWCKSKVVGFSVKDTSSTVSFRDAEFYSDGVEIMKKSPWKERFLARARCIAEDAVLVVEQSFKPVQHGEQLEIQFI